MKKILFICLCMIAITTASAQIRWGVKAGATMSKLSVKYDGKSVGGTELGWGFQGGGVMEYNIGASGVAIQPELLYSMNASKNQVLLGSATTTLNMLQLPVNVKYAFGTDDLKFFVLGGPYASYIFSANMKVKNGGELDLFDKIAGEKSEMNHFDFGLGIGIGVEFNKFTFTIGDQFGLVNLSNDDKTSMKLNTVNLSVGYFF